MLNRPRDQWQPAAKEPWVQQWQRPLRTLFRSSIDFLFPPACPGCGGEIEPATTVSAAWDTRLCAACRREVPTDRTACPRCAAPVGPHLQNESQCTHCCRDTFAFEKVYSLGGYDGALKKWVLRIKEAGGEPLATSLAGEAAARWLAIWQSLGINAIVPVPRHWTKRITHLHEAPLSLGRMLGRHLEIPQVTIRKTKRTPSQATLTPTQRRENLRGVFVADRRTCVGKKILIVDDLLTTGTTAHRVSLALKAAGAEKIWVFSVARAIGFQ